MTSDARPTAASATPGAADEHDVDAVGPMHDAGRYESARATGAWGRVRPYVLATKPRIIELLLVTTVPAMVIAAGA